MKLCECNCGRPAPIAKMTNTRLGHIKGYPVRFIMGHQGRANLRPCAIRHGAARRGQLKPEYLAFIGARYRCTNPRYRQWANYGGRGIKFCFESFEQFFAEVGERPAGNTLDRKDNDGNYEIGNVRWATRSEQNKNKRYRSRRVVEGQTPPSG